MFKENMLKARRAAKELLEVLSASGELKES